MTPLGLARGLAVVLALGAAWVWVESALYDRRYQRRYGPLDGRDDEQQSAVYITDWWRAMKAREAEVIRIWAARQKEAS